MNNLNPLIKLTEHRSAQAISGDGTSYGPTVYVAALQIVAIEPGDSVGRYVKTPFGSSWKEDGIGSVVYFNGGNTEVCESVETVCAQMELALKRMLEARRAKK